MVWLHAIPDLNLKGGTFRQSKKLLQRHRGAKSVGNFLGRIRWGNAAQPGGASDADWELVTFWLTISTFWEQLGVVIDLHFNAQFPFVNDKH